MRDALEKFPVGFFDAVADEWQILLTGTQALIRDPADWLVSGDQDPLTRAADYPILTPAAFVERFLA